MKNCDTPIDLANFTAFTVNISLEKIRTTNEMTKIIISDINVSGYN
ncbi:hypothetical protein C5S42_12370 [Candidatus Methanomarinus sp.]|nr:hypothetical protein C5S42_12370 [ANME-2 cluster archaeon]